MKITKVWVDDVLISRNAAKTSKDTNNQQDRARLKRASLVENVDTKLFQEKIQTFLEQSKAQKLSYNLDPSRVKAVLEGKKTGLLDDLHQETAQEILGIANREALVTADVLKNFKQLRKTQ